MSKFSYATVAAQQKLAASAVGSSCCVACYCAATGFGVPEGLAFIGTLYIDRAPGLLTSGVLRGSLVLGKGWFIATWRSMVHYDRTHFEHILQDGFTQTRINHSGVCEPALL